MSETPPPFSIWRLVKIPAIITLVVTLARLTGELLELSPVLFGSEAGGGFAVVGISWLMPIFGFWFGCRLTGENRSVRRPGLTAVVHLVGMGVLVGGVFAVNEMELGFPQALVGVAICGAVASAFALGSWSALFRANLMYGLCARLPVILITFVVTPLELGTHYEKLPPEMEIESWAERAVQLSGAQLFFWVPATILIGGMLGCLGAALHGRRRPGVIEP